MVAGGDDHVIPVRYQSTVHVSELSLQFLLGGSHPAHRLAKSSQNQTRDQQVCKHLTWTLHPDLGGKLHRVYHYVQ